MMFRKITFALLTTSILTQSISPSIAMEGEDLRNKPLSEKIIRSPHAPLTVQGEYDKTAAGILHYTLKDGKILILLGRRDDSEDPLLGNWCNFGGGAGEDGATDKGNANKKKEALASTASRESAEESNGIYTLHPRLLRKHPFIDWITLKEGKPFLYRMYWQQVNYVDPKVFCDKLQSAEEAHNKEYTDFTWVGAEDLLTAIRKSDPILHVGQTRIKIYGPLFNTLSTASGEAFLDQLSRTKTLKTTAIKNPISEQYVYSSVRKYFNRYYGDATNIDQFYPPFLKHPEVKVSEKPIADLQNRMLENQAQDAKFTKNNPPPNLYETILLKNEQEEETLAEAVTAHGMAMVELKRQFEKQDAAPLPTNVPLWDAHCEETISRIHLAIVLGPDYKSPEHFKGTRNPRREADLANIKEYFRRYTDVEFVQKIIGNVKEEDKAEFKRKINLLEGDYEFFADVLAFEDNNRQWPTFYHGASANTNNLFKSLTYLRQLIRLKPLNNLMALRGTDIYFKDAKTMEELLKRTGLEENSESSAAMMFFNFCLFAGRQTTFSTSSSAEYVLNDHSVTEPDVIKRFEEALTLAGFSKPVYTYYQSLFEQYIKYKKTPWGNSVLIALSQSPENIDRYNYAIAPGEFYNLSTLQILKGIQDEYKRQKKEGVEIFDKDSNTKKKLFPENRLFLDPLRVMDSEKTQITSFNRFPLSQEEQKNYNQEMQQTTAAMLPDWLVQKSTELKGSFLEYPALKKLYKMVTKGVTGQDLQETYNADGFIHLVRTQQLEAIEEYLRNYPEVWQHEAVVNEISAMERDYRTCSYIKTLQRVKIRATDNKPRGTTPLHKAVCERNIEEVLKLLLDKDNVDPNSKDRQGEIPLHMAIRWGNSKVIQMFLDNDKVDLNATDDEGDTPLHTAARRGKIEVIKLLLDKDKVEPNSKNIEGQTPLHLALHLAVEQEKPRSRRVFIDYRTVIKLFLDYNKVDPNALDYNKHTPLTRAAEYGSTDILDLFLSNPNVAIKAKDPFGVPILHSAITGGQINNVKLLLEKGAEVNTKDDDVGYTPLTLASILDFNEIVKLLKEHNAQ